MPSLPIKKFLKKASSKKQWIFFLLALFMVIIAAGIIIYSFVFLISNFNEAFGVTTIPSPEGGFDIEGFEKLNLIK